MNKVKILVLMSSYNGQKYLKEQLDSILNQKNVDINILVRDDGSNDNTIKILEDYTKKYLNVKYYSAENCGPAQSFRRLINECDINFDYYAFADQDDIWKENKFELAIEDLKKENKNIPLLWYCGLMQFEQNGIQSFFCCDIKRASSFETVIKTFATTNGCTMIFNQTLLKILRSVGPGVIDMHDSWTNAMCIACGGKVICNREYLVMYRIHEEQVLGNKNGYIYKLKKLKNPSQKRLDTVKTMLSSSYILPEKRKYLNEIIEYKKNIKTKCKLLFQPKNQEMTYREDIKFKVQILINAF